MGSKLKDDFEPYWDDEKDWLCTVEFLPRDDPEARSFSAEIIGYLFGYAHLTNTRSLALLGDPDANAYELLFSFSSPEEKEQFLDLVRYNDDMGNGRRLNVPVVSKSREDMADHFGWIGQFFAMDGPASSEWTQKRLNWQPKEPGLLADLDQPHYFAARVASVA